MIIIINRCSMSVHCSMSICWFKYWIEFEHCLVSCLVGFSQHVQVSGMSIVKLGGCRLEVYRRRPISPNNDEMQFAQSAMKGLNAQCNAFETGANIQLWRCSGNMQTRMETLKHYTEMQDNIHTQHMEHIQTHNTTCGHMCGPHRIRY